MQGLNRQIRRMCEHFGYEVTKLERTRIMNVSLTGLPPGEWRDLTDDELIALFKLIENSTSEAKPKAKPQAAKKTCGESGKARREKPGQTGGQTLYPTGAEKERALISACRALRCSRTRKTSCFRPVYKPAVFSLPAGFLRGHFTLRHQLIDVLFLYVIRFRVAERASVCDAGAIEQRFQLPLFTLRHLFCVNLVSAIGLSPHGMCFECTRCPVLYMWGAQLWKAPPRCR